MENLILILLLIGFLIMLAIVVAMLVNNWIKSNKGKIDEK